MKEVRINIRCNKFGLSCTVQVKVSRLDGNGKCLNDRRTILKLLTDTDINCSDVINKNIPICWH